MKRKTKIIQFDGYSQTILYRVCNEHPSTSASATICAGSIGT